MSTPKFSVGDKVRTKLGTEFFIMRINTNHRDGGHVYSDNDFDQGGHMEEALTLVVDESCDKKQKPTSVLIDDDRELLRSLVNDIGKYMAADSRRATSMSNEQLLELIGLRESIADVDLLANDGIPF